MPIRRHYVACLAVPVPYRAWAARLAMYTCIECIRLATQWCAVVFKQTALHAQGSRSLRHTKHAVGNMHVWDDIGFDIQPSY